MRGVSYVQKLPFWRFIYFMAAYKNSRISATKRTIFTKFSAQTGKRLDLQDPALLKNNFFRLIPHFSRGQSHISCKMQNCASLYIVASTCKMLNTLQNARSLIRGSCKRVHFARTQKICTCHTTNLGTSRCSST